jgi:peptide subunit release factor 1 (eRF1)
MMISKADMETLIGREGKSGHPVLSVYLDVDQSKETNLNRKFEVSLGNLLRELEQGIADQYEREEFAATAERSTRFVSGYRPGARSLVIFCDASEDFLWSRELDVPLLSEARWSETLYLRPLIETLDEYERYGVILTDRARARLFTVHLGKIKEQGESFAPGEVKIFKAPGRDHIRSDMRFQRKADQYAYRHLKRVAELAVELAERHAFDRLMLAGPVEATGQLQQSLPRQWQSRIVALLDLPVESDQQTVLAATLRAAEEAERNGEMTSVEELISNAARAEQRAVTGLDATLKALRLGRIWQFVYADDFAPPGGRCANCSTLFWEMPESCDYCGAAVRPVDDLVEQAAQRVFASGGKIEHVSGAAAERLRAAGGVGAFLKF